MMLPLSIEMPMAVADTSLQLKKGVQSKVFLQRKMLCDSILKESCYKVGVHI